MGAGRSGLIDLSYHDIVVSRIVDHADHRGDFHGRRRRDRSCRSERRRPRRADARRPLRRHALRRSPRAPTCCSVVVGAPSGCSTTPWSKGMRIVGIDFRDGILFVPEVLLAANAMKGGMEILRPLLAETGAEPIGKVVIGTVKGDIHDIGKNLVAMMLEGAGFEVIDLGINTDAAEFLAALDEHKPDILGMSALLTTTMPYMKVVIDTLKEQGRRDDQIVLVGGAPLNEEFGTAIGADAYCRDAAVAAETAKSLVQARRAGIRAATRRRLRSETVIDRASARSGRSSSPVARWPPTCARVLRGQRPRRRASRSRYLPANLHNRPQRIVPELRPLVDAAGAAGRPVFIAYADCGTGGLLDACSPSIPGRRHDCRAPTATSSSPARPSSPRCRTTSSAPSTSPTSSPSTSTRWCGAALGLDRAPRAARPVLRQLHPGDAPRPDRRRPGVTIERARRAADRLGLRVRAPARRRSGPRRPRRRVGRRSRCGSVSSGSGGLMARRGAPTSSPSSPGATSPRRSTVAPARTSTSGSCRSDSRARSIGRR